MSDRIIKNRINNSGKSIKYNRYGDKDSRGKFYLMSYRGREFVIKNLYKWCREKGFNHTTIYNTYYNPSYTHKGYKLLYPNYWVCDERVLIEGV